MSFSVSRPSTRLELSTRGHMSPLSKLSASTYSDEPLLEVSQNNAYTGDPVACFPASCGANSVADDETVRGGL